MLLMEDEQIHLSTNMHKRINYFQWVRGSMTTYTKKNVLPYSESLDPGILQWEFYHLSNTVF